MENLLNFTLNELKARFKKDGLEAYRAAQIFDWIYSKGVYDFERMTNLSADFRVRIGERFCVELPEIVQTQGSLKDGSVKLLLKLPGGDLVETVYM
ncbi:MAG: 23S rRNA (adenine(2503)-C(2))-methyltransferase RlmN, partial [Candidatus Omnitrophota bacterium]